MVVASRFIGQVGSKQAHPVPFSKHGHRFLTRNCSMLLIHHRLGFSSFGMHALRLLHILVWLVRDTISLVHFIRHIPVKVQSPLLSSGSTTATNSSARLSLGSHSWYSHPDYHQYFKKKQRQKNLIPNREKTLRDIFFGQGTCLDFVTLFFVMRASWNLYFTVCNRPSPGWFHLRHTRLLIWFHASMFCTQQYNLACKHIIGMHWSTLQYFMRLLGHH